MNIDQLHYICEVAKKGSLSSAAQSFNVTLSAISQSITSLENELGVPLFTRSRGTGATPTPEGKVIISKAYDILLKVQELKAEAMSFSDTVNGILKIATIPGSMHLLVKVIADFKKKYPLVDVELFEKGPREIIDHIRDDSVDVGLIILNETTMKYSDDLLFHSLLEGRMVVGIGADSPLAGHQTVPAELVKEYPIVLYNDEFIRLYMEQFSENHGPVQVLFTSNNTEAIQKAITDNMAITIGLDYSLMNNRDYQEKRMDVVDLDVPEQRIIQFGWVRKEKSYSAATKLFLNMLESYLEEEKTGKKIR
ncbi:MAG: LysR family transcriptional regulator [Bacillus sp. (in: firmicutes)]